MQQFFLGEVIHPISVYFKTDMNAPEFLKHSSNDFAIISYQFYRNILFFLNSQKQSIDLFFNSPKYPILHFSHFDDIREASCLIQNLKLLDESSCHSLYDEHSSLFLPHPKEGIILSRSLDSRKKLLKL